MAQAPSGMHGCVALGITGSISAHKAPDLTGQLVQAGVEVHVLMTPSGARLAAPAACAALSHHPVVTSLWSPEGSRLDELADRADLFAVVPATANTLARLAHGIADDPVSAFALLHPGPTLVAPAMTPQMWLHPATQANCQRLRDRGVLFIGPVPDPRSRGETGLGRLAPLDHILGAIHTQLAAIGLRADQGPRLRILVTAGPTREALDPVRFLSNHSSGRMGYAVAGVAAAAGHDVCLVSGPTALPTPLACRRIDVTSAAEMADAVRSEFPAADALIMAAAVADYRPRTPADHKLKKAPGPLTLELERTEDILATVAADRRPGQRVMGFAAETRDLLANARAKLESKRLDWVVANDVARPDIAFGSDANEVVVLSPDGEEHLPRMSKTDLAARLLAILTAAFPGPPAP